MAAAALDPIASLLWADAAARVHAVIDGARVPGLAGRLAAVPTIAWDRVQRGALDAAAAASATHVVELAAMSPFTDWLLREATPALPGWGLLAGSTRALLDIREHFRSLQMLRLPDGRELAWRWYDPGVLDAFVALATPAQQAALMGPLRVLVAPRADAWTFYTFEAGRLVGEQRRVAPGGR
ncbi:MAG: DUF4123 domain-containing protein [Betaproteobacteria bacterium]